MRITKQKRGGTTDFIADFYAYIVFVLILVLFFILFSLTLGGCDRPGKEMNIVGEKSGNLNQEMLLMNFLRTEVEVNGEQMQIAELIAYSNLNDNYDRLEEVTLEFFEEIDQHVFQSSVCSHLLVNVGTSDVKTIKTNGCATFFASYDYENAAKAIVPLYYGGEELTSEVWMSHASDFQAVNKYGGFQYSGI